MQELLAMSSLSSSIIRYGIQGLALLNDANGRVSVPPKPGVNRIVELITATLVAGIRPHEFHIVFLGPLTKLPRLLVSHSCCRVILYLFSLIQSHIGETRSQNGAFDGLGGAIDLSGVMYHPIWRDKTPQVLLHVITPNELHV